MVNIYMFYEGMVLFDFFLREFGYFENYFIINKRRFFE